MRYLINILIIFLLLSTPSYLLAKTTREQITIKRQEFKTRALEIRDKNKQEIVKRIDNRITTLNKKHTERFTKLLDKLSSILDRIEVKSTELENEEVNVSEVDVLVQIARDAIEVAQNEVESQASKDYVIELDSESNLGQVVSAAFNEFKDDMAVVRDSVKVARDAVHEAAIAIKELIRISNAEDGSAE